MRITVITSWFTDVIGGSGTGVFFNSFVSGLRDRGFDVELVAPVLRAKDYVNVTLERFLFNSQLNSDSRIQDADILIGFDYDGYGLNPQNRPPMIASAHAVYGDVLRWETGDVRTMVEAQAFFDRVSMEQADRVTCGSDYARERILDLYHIDPYKVTTIPHGMMPQNWMRLAHKLERHENDHPILLAVGKMYPRKRLDILLNAMPALVGLHPNVELRIAGDGLEFDKMRALSQSLGIERNVTWLGHVKDDMTFAREWVQADVFCHPSLQETFGFVYLEAMSLGKPIVASNAGAAPEVVGECGLLVDKNDSVGFANALDRLLLDADLRSTIGACGRKRAEAYTQRRMIDGYVSIMDDLLEARAGYHNGNGHKTLISSVKWQ